MKKYLSISILFILLIGGKTSYAQLHPILDRFTVLESDDNVFISCIISTGNTCNGIDVLRSTDSVNFISIGRIGGVCGSSSEAIAYNFIDENPIKNKPMYYKLELGGYGFTNILSVSIIDTKEFGFQLRPNPANEQTVIYFENRSNMVHILTLFDNSGGIILSKTTTDSSFLLDVSDFRTGIYYFTISTGLYKQGVSGKLLVYH